MAETSVIIPTYNREETISRAINSVLAQKNCDLEIIIVDDGSTDKTASLIKNQFPSVNLIQQKHQGVGAARNLGILTAGGEYIALLDSDDEWLPGKLKKQLTTFNQNPDISIISTGGVFLDPVGKVLKIQSVQQSGFLLEALLYKNPIITSSVILRRDCFLQEKLLFRTDLPSLVDWELWIRLSARYKMILISDVLVRLYRFPDSIEARASADMVVERYEMILSGLKSDPIIAPVIQRNWTSLQNNRNYLYAYYAYLQGDLRTARLNAIKALRASPHKWKTILPIIFIKPALFNRLKLLLNNQSSSDEFYAASTDHHY